MCVWVGVWVCGWVGVVAIVCLCLGWCVFDSYLTAAIALSTGSIRVAMKAVTTPFVLVLQQDLPFARPIDALQTLRTLEANPSIKHIRSSAPVSCISCASPAVPPLPPNPLSFGLSW